VFNSFLKPAAHGTTRFRDATQLVRVDKVPVRRLEAILDDLIATRPGARIFLKIDTQGYDLQVVRGAGRRLPAIRALQTELAARATYEGMPTFAPGARRARRPRVRGHGAVPRGARARSPAGHRVRLRDVPEGACVSRA